MPRMGRRLWHHPEDDVRKLTILMTDVRPISHHLQNLTQNEWKTYVKPQNIIFPGENTGKMLPDLGLSIDFFQELIPKA